MKWFKHMSDMADDVKVKRLRRKYGVEGYGLYNYILERIVNNLQKNSPLPELEEEAQDIAGELGMDTLRVEEIMKFAIDQGLFTVDEVTGRLVAHKVYKFLEESTTRSSELKAMIKNYKDSIAYSQNLQMPDDVSDSLGQSETVSDNPGLSPDSQRLSGLEQNRREENRTEEKSVSASDDAAAPSDDQPFPEPGKSREPTPMKGELEKSIDNAFRSQHEYTAFAKERAQVKHIAKSCRARDPDNPQEYANTMLTAFLWLQRHGEQFWQKQPFTPSTMVSLWDRIERELERVQEQERLSPEVSEFIQEAMAQ